ncbi:MAG: hydrogenase maturation nickel metallochaperone HypA [Chitinophagaceae bacterium]
MHEVSLVQNIFSTLKADFPNDMDKIIAIYLSVGELSNIQPTLMQNAFQAILVEKPFLSQNMQLHVEVLPILIHCDKCNLDNLVKYYKFVCSQCGTPSKHIIQGQEILIRKVEFYRYNK